MTSAIQPDDAQPVADDELLYRRIPVSQHWYDPAADPKPLLHAFRPRADDATQFKTSCICVARRELSHTYKLPSL